MKFMIILVLTGLLVVTGFCPAFAGDALQININTASAEELAQLSGVGPRHAAGIIEFRQKNGPFTNPKELMQVLGIGPRIFEKNKDIIQVEGPAPEQAKK